ncbi:22836_t:CDS:2, partial [Rhizophagus irregularis]
AGELNGFWGGDLGRPLEDYTHIIIDSPHSVLKQELTGVLTQEHDEQVPEEDNQVDDGKDN